MTKGFKKKLKFTGIGLVSFLVILYIIAQLWISFGLNPLIDKLIKNGVVNASDSLYALNYRKLTFSIPTRTLVLKDVDLKADTARYAKRKAIATHVPSGLVNIHLNELKITGIEFYKAWANKNLKAGNIIIENPEITYTLFDTLSRRDSVVKQPVNFDLYKLFSEKFHSLTVQNIIVSNAAFRLYENAEDTTAAVSGNGIQIAVTSLRIDSAYSANRYEIDLATKIRISIAEAHWILPDSIYRIQFSNMKLDATKQSLNFERIQVVPLAGKFALSKIKGYEDDLIQMNAESLAFQNLDVNLLLYNHSISCRHLRIEDLNLKAFRYKGAPHKPGYRALPVEQLRRAPLMVRIDSIKLMNGRVEYAEQIPGNSFPGTVFFDSIRGSILNVSNDFISLSKNPYCTILADGNVMGKSELKVKVSFDQTSLVDSFTFEGTLGKLELNLFNSLILQSAQVKLEKGSLDDLAFHIAGTTHSASGGMTMKYHDLTVEMTQKGKNDDGKVSQAVKKNIQSFFANTFAIVSENPKDNITRHATLYQKRDTEKYIFNYFWKTILSGVKETILTNGMKTAMKTEKKKSLAK